MLWRGGCRSFRSEFGNVLAKPLGGIELRQQFDRRDFQRLAKVEHLEVADPDELALDFRNPRAINFPAENLKPCRKVGLLEAEIVAALSHLRPDYILVHCAHGGTSGDEIGEVEAPVWELNSDPKKQLAIALYDARRRAKSSAVFLPRPPRHHVFQMMKKLVASHSKDPAEIERLVVQYRSLLCFDLRELLLAALPAFALQLSGDFA